ncbi:MAG: YbhB/YbcL family Raf kinase inhibitor-like protein [Hamadaea sp.]|nr:YbhB/YbcL family Raf kinase inhibitor-like protein [Hamadaea sp.]
MRGRARRVCSTLAAGLLAATSLTAALAPATRAAAAPTRFEAEDAPAVCDGTIDSNWTGFSGTGFCNTTNAVGGSVTWTVSSPTAGTATLAIRYANGTTTDRPANVLVNGAAAGSTVSFAGTGAWTTWVTKTVSVPVVAGSNTIKLAATTANGDANIDYLEFDPPPSFTDYQAEDAVITLGVVESNHTGYTGTGFVNGDNVVGSAVEWTVGVPSAGVYPVTLRYSNGTTVDRPMDVSVNGTVAAPGISFPSTTNWDTWADRTISLSLAAGTNKIKAISTTVNGGPNLDRLRVTAPADTQPPTAPANLRVVGEVRPYGVDLAWDASTDNVGVAQYKIYNGGNVVQVVGGNITTATLTLTPNTTYVITVLAYDAVGNASQASNNVPITTPPSDDTTPPSQPSGVRTTNVAATSVSLAWTASTDNIGVAGYHVFSDGVQFATVPDLTATADSLTPSTTYVFSVEAFDANGNVSTRSAGLSVTTTAGGTGGTGGDPVFDRNVNTAMDLPWGIGFLPDGNALVAERDRFEIVLVTPAGQRTVVGKITEAVTTTGEGGLLGLAISPTFATDHYVYVMHTASSDNRVVRFKYENGAIGAREPLVTGIAKNRFHNGGRIKFGPDGYLYITTGDAQDGTKAQNLSSLNGKILRVTTTGAAAPGNPFGTRVYSYGHRNPQGLAWDSAGRLWESEFGDSTWDELNLIQAGGNYGWPTCEGTCSTSGMINPVRTWDVASASPSGIEIVNDWIYMAAVRGGRLWVMHITGSTTDTPRAFFNGTWGRLRTVVKTPDGGLWLTSTNNDKDGGTPSTLDNVIVRLKFATPPFTLTSTAFANNGSIPTKYTCQQDGVSGNDISPPMSWGPGTTAAKSYAIVLIDTANSNKHWVIWDIPATRTFLPEGLGLGFTVPGISGAKQKAMSTGDKALQYFGPCPGGTSHLYEFRLYALNVTTLPGVDSSSSVATVETAILANDLATTKLAGNSAAHT